MMFSFSSHYVLRPRLRVGGGSGTGTGTGTVAKGDETDYSIK